MNTDPLLQQGEKTWALRGYWHAQIGLETPPPTHPDELTAYQIGYTMGLNFEPQELAHVWEAPIA